MEVSRSLFWIPKRRSRRTVSSDEFVVGVAVVVVVVFFVWMGRGRLSLSSFGRGRMGRPTPLNI